MKTITILMDSLNRHLLSPWGGPIATPNMERLFKRGMIADRHYVASLPCMPARRDMMTGRVNFFEGAWGPIEPWDETCIDKLKAAGVYTHMITDHYHYFHCGGENYHTLFNSWEFERGQECDVWKAKAKDPTLPKTMGRSIDRRSYWVNRDASNLQDDMSYPTPRCFLQAAEFIKNNASEEPWHLHLEVFDPHEPFDCPQHWLDKTGDQRQKDYLYNWPSYAKVGRDGEDEGDVLHIRHRYAATLMMADHYLGKMLDEMDVQDAWKDTCLILTTDHGHLLGEHGYWAKNYMCDYEEITHIPMVICHPEIKPGSRCSQLTWTPDLAPTLLDLHGVSPLKHAHGKSWLPFIRGSQEPNHELVAMGYFGKDVSISDGKKTYIRQPFAGSVCYHHTLMPRGGTNFFQKKDMLNAEYGDFLPHAEGMKVLRFLRKSHRHADAPENHILFDLENDPKQLTPIFDEQQQEPWVQRLSAFMQNLEAPEWQWERLGIKK